MRPAIEPGDWLLVDPTTGAWPRPGSIVVFREPDTDVLAIKRVAARSGHVQLPDGLLHLAPNDAWLLGDLAERSIDSRHLRTRAAGAPRRAGLVPLRTECGGSGGWGGRRGRAVEQGRAAPALIEPSRDSL